MLLAPTKPSLAGWDPNAPTPTFPETLDAQIDQTFYNIDLAMRAAGGKGISQVFSIRSYHPQIKATPDAMDLMKKSFEKWFPNHRPIWTAVGVESLALPKMKIEIEAVAYDPQNGGMGV
ncbi:uncharacterized protein E0L32_004439 [Thyridium curvatum]|uniref:Uncharacterized protein n=1 Tax=Thyridium curvatum TaxID=1093900 RepID=A0A507BDM7_9PEZI|nr:uncharacterized protein E0L32_004439 [Thyridium curvatum]TPX15459.1 hypothetical protein E0L32_004439 [Thyridium curvatum]